MDNSQAIACTSTVYPSPVQCVPLVISFAMAVFHLEMEMKKKPSPSLLSHEQTGRCSVRRMCQRSCSQRPPAGLPIGELVVIDSRVDTDSSAWFVVVEVTVQHQLMRLAHRRSIGAYFRSLEDEDNHEKA